MGVIYFLNQVGFVGLYFFVPSMVQQMQASSPFVVGLLSSTVGIGFLLGVLILPRVHRRVSGDCFFLGIVTAALALSSALFMLTSLPTVQLLLFVTTAFCAGGILPIYWAVAMKNLHGIQAAAGLAFINTIGLMGGFVGPYLFGLIEKQTGSSASGFGIILASALLGLILIPALAKAIQSETQQKSLNTFGLSPQ
jgi:MFS family permease